AAAACGIAAARCEPGDVRSASPPVWRADAGRSTMVFSKSALSPPAPAPLASPRNFSLYLPSSMTSLFCRKCFLTGLPLTTVPLVLPRSSRKESFRIVTMTACSPLTARLSIWMSLWGLRPMGALLGQGNLLEHQPVHAEDQFRHSVPLGEVVILTTRTPWLLRPGHPDIPAGRGP